MVAQLNRNIKDIIEEYPAVGELLDKHEIACVTCNVGTCLLKDIIEIHNLTSYDEQAVLSEIAEVIFPGQGVAIPLSETKPTAKSHAFSPPIRKLVDEHMHIKKLVAHIPYLISELTSGSVRGRQLVERSLDFIRSYADRFHHAKEEDILFPFFDENAEIFQVMRRDHETARGHVPAMVSAVADGDDEAIVIHLEAYAALLSEHIRKEDEVLYPWIDRNLSMTQVGELFSRFSEVDAEFGNNPRGHEAFVEKLKAAER